MTTYYWIAGSSGNWNDSANWSLISGGLGGVGVPNSGDTAIFDGNGLGNCVMNVALTSNVTITRNSGYTGTLDNATNDLDHSVGDVTGDFASLTMGDATWTCNGDWTPGSNVTRNNSLLVMTGTSKTLSTASDVEDLTINSGATITTDGGGNASVRGVFTLNGSLTVDTDALILRSTVTIASTATLTGSGKIRSQGVSMSINSAATLTLTEIEFRNTQTIPARDYSDVADVNFNATNVGTSTFTIGSGTITVDGFHVNSTSGRTAAVTGSANNPDWVIQGDVTINVAGDVTWTAGTGTITANGTADQSWRWYDSVNMTAIQTTEDIIINKSAGTLTLASDIKAESFTGTDAHFDPAGYNIDTTNDFDITDGFTIEPTGLNGSAITVGGDFSVAGSFGNELDLRATAAWTLTVTGVADADYVRVANSDASGGISVTATNSFDHGGNSNWSGLTLAASDAAQLINGGLVNRGLVNGGLL